MLIANIIELSRSILQTTSLDDGAPVSNNVVLLITKQCLTITQLLTESIS